VHLAQLYEAGPSSGGSNSSGGAWRTRLGLLQPKCAPHGMAWRCHLNSTLPIDAHARHVAGCRREVRRAACVRARNAGRGSHASVNARGCQGMFCHAGKSRETCYRGAPDHVLSLSVMQPVTAASVGARISSGCGNGRGSWGESMGTEHLHLEPRAKRVRHTAMPSGCRGQGHLLRVGCSRRCMPCIARTGCCGASRGTARHSTLCCLLGQGPQGLRLG
jgi:hypothetical protein